jgi:hypothetical protein
LGSGCWGFAVAVATSAKIAVHAMNIALSKLANLMMAYTLSKYVRTAWAIVSLDSLPFIQAQVLALLDMCNYFDLILYHEVAERIFCEQRKTCKYLGAKRSR